MYKHLLVVFGDSELARRALATAIELARRLSVPLRVLVVDGSIPTPIMASAFSTSDPRVVEDAMAGEDRRNSALAQEAQTAADAAGVAVDIEVVQGDEVALIGDAVERCGCDLLILGLQSRPGLVERLTRGVTDRVRCSVLAVR
jgi:nucleotide-binding universal stress UspA family protein